MIDLRSLAEGIAWAVWRRLTGKHARRPGEIVARKPGSAFCGSGKPRLVRLSDESDGGLHAIDSCCCLCRDPYCREWANVQIVEGPYRGDWMCHLSECQMEEPTAEDWARYDSERRTVYYRESAKEIDPDA